MAKNKIIHINKNNCSEKLEVTVGSIKKISCENIDK